MTQRVDKCDVTSMASSNTKTRRTNTNKGLKSAFPLSSSAQTTVAVKFHVQSGSRVSTITSAQRDRRDVQVQVWGLGTEAIATALATPLERHCFRLQRSAGISISGLLEPAGFWPSRIEHPDSTVGAGTSAGIVLHPPTAVDHCQDVTEMKKLVLYVHK